MKKNYFLGAAAAFGLLAFSSCSNDDDPVLGQGEVATGEQVIVLDMQDTDVLSTKSRPLFSTTNKGAEQVTDVQLLVFGFKAVNGEYRFVKKLPAITNWNNSSDDYDYGRKYEIKLTGENKLKSSTDPEGYDKYIILAVGQDESDLTSIPAPYKIELGTDDTKDKYVKELADGTWTKGKVWNVASTPGNGFWQTAAIDYTQTNGKERAGEIFSGVSSPIEFKADGGFSTTVLLKRQVAGVLGYFSRIPATVGEKTVTGIRLVSSARNNSLDLSTALADQEDDATHGLPGSKRTETVVNGFNAGNNDADAKFGLGEETPEKDAYTVYEINLQKWFDWSSETKTWSAKIKDSTGEESEVVTEEIHIMAYDYKLQSTYRVVGNVYPTLVEGSTSTSYLYGTDVYWAPSFGYYYIQSAAVHMGLVGVGEQRVLKIKIVECPEGGYV